MGCDDDEMMLFRRCCARDRRMRIARTRDRASRERLVGDEVFLSAIDAAFFLERVHIMTKYASWSGNIPRRGENWI